jgi:hypothetical protein
MNSSKQWIVAGLVLALGVSSCDTGTGGTKTAEKCTEIDLKGVCPVGTTPNLDAAATAQCDTSGSASGSQGATGEAAGSASFDQVCRSSGTCQVLCEVTLECPFGVKAITATEVVCAAKEEANACGDGVCLGDENPVSCAKDCERECDVDDTACDGAVLKTCSPKGLWSPTACEPGTDVRGGKRRGSLQAASRRLRPRRHAVQRRRHSDLHRPWAVGPKRPVPGRADLQPGDGAVRQHL